jgi:hypothetical protein
VEVSAAIGWGILTGERLYAASAGRRRTMRVFECDYCGKQLEAPDDEQLYGRVWEHMDQTHFDRGLSNEQIQDLLSEKAYTRDDAEKGAIDERGSVGG